jgi:hypothetical protein
LKKITIPSSVELIGERGFFSCKSLREITFEAGSKLRRIGGRAFDNTGLWKIVIPSSVEVIGGRCFSGCISLREVTCETGSRLKEIGSDAF